MLAGEAWTDLQEDRRENFGKALVSLASLMDREQSQRICRPVADILAQALQWEKDAHKRWGLARGLASVVGSLGNEEASELCAPLARLLARDLQQGPSGEDHDNLMYALCSLIPRVNPLEAGELLIRVRRQESSRQNQVFLAWSMSQVLKRINIHSLARPHPEILQMVAGGLEMAADDLDKASAGVVGERYQIADGLAAATNSLEAEAAARILTLAIRKECEDVSPAIETLSDGLVTVAKRMKASEAARVCGQAIQILDTAMTKDIFIMHRGYLVKAMGDLSPWLEPGEASRLYKNASDSMLAILRMEPDKFDVRDLSNLLMSSRCLDLLERNHLCLEVARILAGALMNDSGGDNRVSEARGLAFVAAQLDAREADRICNEVLQWLRRNPPGDSKHVSHRAASFCDEMAALLDQVSTDTANATAPEVAAWVCDGTGVNGHATFLNTVLSDGSREQWRRRAKEAAEESDPMMVEVILTAPLPCRLSTPDLVGLLKMPTCFGEARRVVLDHLGRRYGRRFANHWQFVRFAEEAGLGLDFTSPPKRPEAWTPRGHVPDAVQRSTGK